MKTEREREERKRRGGGRHLGLTHALHTCVEHRYLARTSEPRERHLWTCWVLFPGEQVCQVESHMG